MKTLYIECNMGAAGDMLMAALLELHDDPDGFITRLNALSIPGVNVSSSPSVKCGITGTHVTVMVSGEEEISSDAHDHAHSDDHSHDHTHEHTASHEHQHSSMHRIEDIINDLDVSAKVKENALAIYRLIAEAESHVHAVPVAQIHFHEIGAMDAVADIVGVCMLIDEIAPDYIMVSSVNTGSGSVHCAHGILPVPAPATAYILRDAPIYSGNVSGELCTPTGAAILKHFAKSFGPMPEMLVEKIGYGMGKKDFEAANCVRVFLSESAQQASGPNGQAAELRCNVDDMTGEAIGYACRLLLAQGALDVFVTPVQMKKDRPGSLITCICGISQADHFAELLLKNTTTFGVRKMVCDRYMLEREVREVDTPYGGIRVKSGYGYDVDKCKVEYADIAAAAVRLGLPLAQIEDCVYEHIRKESNRDNT